MKNRMNHAKYLAILMVGFTVLMGWINPSGPAGKNAYAQYYCTLNCSVTAPSTGAAGNPVNFGARVTAYYCEGSPSYSWEFGDGSTASSVNAAHTYAAAGTYSWSLTVTIGD